MAFVDGAPHCCARWRSERTWAGDAVAGQPAPARKNAAAADAGNLSWLCAGAIAAGAAILATASPQQDSLRSRPAARRHSAGLAALAVAGASMSACATADARALDDLQCCPVQRCAVADAGGRRVSFDLAVETCMFDAFGSTCLDQQLDGLGLCPASAAACAQSVHGEDLARSSVETPPGGGPPDSTPLHSLRPHLGAAHLADMDVPSGNPAPRDAPLTPSSTQGTDEDGDACALM